MYQRAFITTLSVIAARRLAPCRASFDTAREVERAVKRTRRSALAALGAGVSLLVAMAAGGAANARALDTVMTTSYSSSGSCANACGMRGSSIRE